MRFNFRLEKSFILDRVHEKKWTMEDFVKWYEKSQLEVEALFQEIFSKDRYTDLKFAMQRNEEEKQKTEA